MFLNDISQLFSNIAQIAIYRLQPNFAAYLKALLHDLPLEYDMLHNILNLIIIASSFIFRAEQIVNSDID